MSDKTRIKIYISEHKPSEHVKDKLFFPVQVGAALKDYRLPNVDYDDMGENISDKNPRFCELTAQYWAWKNTDADYYGFFHYRRYLSFNPQINETPDVWGNIIAPSITQSTTNHYKLNEHHIHNIVDEYDIVIPTPKDIRTMPKSGRNNREQFLSSGFLHEKDLDIMLDVLQEKHPEMMPYALQYLAGHTSYFNNIFIMKKKIFDEYCTWLFDILEECDKRIDYTDYSVEAIRTPGHLAERLFNIYIACLRDTRDYKIKELPTVVFLDTDPVCSTTPAFDKHNIAIAMSASDNYAPYIAATLTSILENSDRTHNYDIIIMHKNISAKNQEHLRNIFSDQNNFSLRFINISIYEERFKSLFLRGHFTIETWFRLLMPELLLDYKKVLYLDSDLIINANIADLYETNIDNYLLAACHDADTAGLYNGFEPNKKNYMDKILKIKKPYTYFQAGVILFNLEEFRKTYSTDEMLKFASSYDWELLDQDVLNFLAQDKVKFVDMSWNVMFDWRNIRISEIISRAPKYLYDEYIKAHNAPKIVHYAGPDKPWQDPSADYAELFWKYSRKTVFYEQVIFDAFRTKPQDGLTKKIAKKILPNGTKRNLWAKRIYSKLR